MAHYDVGILQSSKISRNNYTVTYSNPTDVFEFDLSQNGTINLDLHDISRGDDADLYLYRDNGNGSFDREKDTLWAQSRNGGNSDDSIAHAATAGTYFAEVERYARGSSGTVTYDLDASATYSSGSSFPSSSAPGLKFNFTYEGNGSGSSKVSQQQMIAFEMAGRIWSQYLDDDMTVNIHVDMSNNLPTNVIGGAIPGFIDEQYSTLRSNLSNDKSSYDDNIAVSNLDSTALDAKIRLQASDGSWAWYRAKNPAISPTRANIKAVDSSQSVRHDSTLDGYILMSNLHDSSYSWHYDQYDSWGQSSSYLDSNKLDFLSVAVHEIGHVLGFISGVDYQSADWLSLYSGDLFSEAVKEKKLEVTRNRVGVSSTLDLFRYSQNVGNSGSGNDLSIGGNPYFSINGGSTELRDFSNGRSNDAWLVSRINGGLHNYQASHWKLGTDGIMVPGIAPGQRNTISSEELVAFDVMGFDRTGGFSAPNYASLYQSAQATVSQYSNSRKIQSRLDEVIALIEASPMYERRRSTRGSARQEVLEVFAQEALHSTFDEEAWQVFLDSITLNELGTSGNDRMAGTIGNDRFRGMDKADKLMGYEGDDILRGNRGDDRLLGGDGDDALVGGIGRDVLKGEIGADRLRGGIGFDVLIGGAGADIFVIEDKVGFDVIRDFNPKEDQLFLADDIEVSIGQRNNHTTIVLSNAEDNILAVLRNVDATMVSIE